MTRNIFQRWLQHYLLFHMVFCNVTLPLPLFFFFCRSTACGILVPRPEIEPMPPAVEAHGVLTTGSPGIPYPSLVKRSLFLHSLEMGIEYSGSDAVQSRIQFLTDLAIYTYSLLECVLLRMLQLRTQPPCCRKPKARGKSHM